MSKVVNKNQTKTKAARKKYKMNNNSFFDKYLPMCYQKKLKIISMKQDDGKNLYRITIKGEKISGGRHRRPIHELFLIGNFDVVNKKEIQKLQIKNTVEKLRRSLNEKNESPQLQFLKNYKKYLKAKGGYDEEDDKVCKVLSENSFENSEEETIIM